MKSRSLLALTGGMFLSLLPAALAHADSFHFVVDPASSTVNAGDNSGLVNVYVVETGGTTLHDTGLFAAVFNLAVSGGPGSIHEANPDGQFISGGGVNNPDGTWTVSEFTIPNVTADSDRILLGTFSVDIPAAAADGSVTTITVSDSDQAPFITDLDTLSTISVDDGSADFTAAAAAATPVPLPPAAPAGLVLLAGTAAAASLRRRHQPTG